MTSLFASSYGARIKDHLREAIISGDLSPGQRLNEVKLAADLGVSRTPLREAVASLASEGWLELAPHKGATVTDFTPRDIDELLGVRWILELGALDLIFKRSDVSSAAAYLQKAALRSDAALRTRRYSPDPSSDFHHVLLVQSGNDSLVQIGQSVHAKLRAVRFRSGAAERRRELADSEHAAIIDAVQAVDHHAAREALMHHLNAAAQLMRSLTDRSNDT